MTLLQAWIPSMVAVGALGLHWFVVRSMLTGHKKDLKERIMALEDQLQGQVATIEAQLKSIKTEFMPTAQHLLVCENNTLKIREFFQHEIGQLKDDIFKYLRKIEQSIQNGHSADS